MKLIFFLIALFLTACATVSYCDYDLYGNGWKRADAAPKDLIDEYNKNNIWFTNKAGDFIACPELVKEGVCINVYKIYHRRNDGSYESDHIVCME